MAKDAMTAQKNAASAASGASGATSAAGGGASLGGLRARFAGRWQIPLLIAAGLALYTGIARQAARHHPVSFEEHLERVALLREANALGRAATYIRYLLGQSHRAPIERAELYRLYAQVAFQAESGLTAHGAANTKAIISNLQRAQEDGATFSAVDWYALGEAFRWAGRWAESIEALGKALEAGVTQPDAVRRKRVEMRLATTALTDPKNVADITAVLSDLEASPENFHWATDLTVDRLLSAGEADEALKLVKQAEKRLGDSPVQQSVKYLEALCLRTMGHRDEAEGLLRRIREECATRDELWARTGWLLARVQQEDDRPQMALAFYEEVLRSFASGDLKWACELGRAECLARLERFDAAREVFARVIDQRAAWERSRYVTAGAVRSSLIVIAERLRGAGSYEASNGYYRLGLKLNGPEAVAQRAHYTGQLAANCRSLGVQARDANDARVAARWFAEAARLGLVRADTETQDQFQAEALEGAAEDFDAAGQTDEMIRTLTKLVARHPTNVRRSAGMFRLAQALEAQGRYAEAAASYQEIMTVYRRLPDALSSMVPLARCLIRQGGDTAQRGVAILTEIVDDLGPEEIFTPRATEYREALFELAEFYTQADAAQFPNRDELAISRLEDALALYPAAAEAPKLLFLLGESYRRSAGRLREAVKKELDARTRDESARAAEDRLRRAVDAYERIVTRLAGQDGSALSESERVYLRSSYLYRADCLFDLGDFAAAADGYREAQWRFEADPSAVSAGVQLYHCFVRLGNANEARMALARLGWLLKKLPDTAFEARRGMSSKAYWEGLIARLEQTSGDVLAGAR